MVRKRRCTASLHLLGLDVAQLSSPALGSLVTRAGRVAERVSVANAERAMASTPVLGTGARGARGRPGAQHRLPFISEPGSPGWLVTYLPRCYRG